MVKFCFLCRINEHTRPFLIPVQAIRTICVAGELAAKRTLAIAIGEKELLAYDRILTIHADVVSRVVNIIYIVTTTLLVRSDVLVECGKWRALTRTSSIIVEDGPAVQPVGGQFCKLGPDSDLKGFSN